MPGWYGNFSILLPKRASIMRTQPFKHLLNAYMAFCERLAVIYLAVNHVYSCVNTLIFQWEKTVCRSVFLTIWLCILSIELAKTHSFRLFLGDFAH